MPIQWIHRFDIAAHVPLEGTITYAALAASARVDEALLKRLLRSAMLSAHLFREPEPGRVAHSASSRLLARDADLRGLLEFELTILAPALARTVDAQRKWKFSDAPTHTGFNLALEYPDRPFYSFVAEHQEKRDALDGAFVEFARTEGWAKKHLLSGFDWDSLPAEGKIVDVGGSLGHNSMFLAKEFPKFKFVVQDLPGVATEGKMRLPSDMANTISFQAYDFLTPQPIQDADVYFFQNVFVDHSDDEAVLMLRNTRNAMKKPGAKLIIREPVVPEPGTIPVEDELRIRTFSAIGDAGDELDAEEMFGALP
ncbi:hypothetical protein M409DRAFT_50693 [Zasmidium cellare ATCC 36951]|uniref:O-methyltransferase C-terminal domain-containing protein n=1 Tax=Zasmidium cellare ATCC 36951 TaxID=1080233 RepID=A0A6A6D0P8_ZASCE|nr:uncharacterized protein M409DRAFT_50693 [Zasmidium cellare ATCC 36951]KAF2171226.1 hypothetical protein M409DRAFT_50693 [Zasmidium cellare ATCC 36951]